MFDSVEKTGKKMSSFNCTCYVIDVLFRITLREGYVSRSILIIPLFFFLIHLSCTNTQAIQLEVGDRVRVTAPVIEPDRIKGTVAELDESVMVLSVRDSSFYVAHSLIRNLETSIGKKRTVGRGFLIGSFTGTLVFGLLSIYTNNACGFAEECMLANRNGDAFLSGATAGLIIGGMSGAITGFFIKTDRWQKVPVSMAMDLAPASSHIQSRTIQPKISVKFTLR